MALRSIIILFILGLSIQNLNAQAFSWKLNWENNSAKSISFFGESDLKAAKVKVSLSGKEHAIIGRYVQLNDTIKFIPLVPFSLNEQYQVFQNDILLFDFTIDRKLTKPQLLSIYPLGRKVPANLLKFYIQFDQPIGEINPYNKVSILRDGKALEEAILPLSPALWNEDYTILTVWIAPGRVKSDLGPNSRLGEVLHNNEKLIIQVAPMRAKSGEMMGASYKKEIEVIKRDNNKPSIENWSIKEPDLLTKNKLKIIIDEPMDYLSTLNGLKLYSGDHQVFGQFDMLEEHLVIFSPDSIWLRGEYQLIINGTVEDLAANSFNRLFERDLKKDTQFISSEKRTIQFSIK